MFFFNTNVGGGIIFLENVHFDGLIVISVKNASDRGVRPCVKKKMYKTDHLCPENVVEKHWSLQIDFYTAETIYFFKIIITVVFRKFKCTKNRGQAISSCEFD